MSLRVQRRQGLRWGIGLGMGVGLGLGFGPGPSGTIAAVRAAAAERRAGRLVWDQRVLPGFGTTLALKAGHEDAGRLAAALDEAVVLLQSLHRTMNLFDPGSEVSRLNRDGRLPQASAALRELLAVATEVSSRSDGDFDLSVQPLWASHACARDQGRVPTEDERAAALQRVDWRGVRVDGAAVWLRPGQALTVNGIAQGDALDRVSAVFARHGVRDAVLDTGEWRGLGRRADGGAWQLGVDDPRAAGRLLATLALDGRCVATSSGDGLRFTPDGRLHHLFDPHRGVSPTGWRSVTVLAERGALADALTKVVYVGGPARLDPIARAWDIDVLALEADGTLRMTPRLRRRLQA